MHFFSHLTPLPQSISNLPLPLSDVSIDYPDKFTMLLSMCINDLSPSRSFFHSHTEATGVLLGRRHFDRDACVCVKCVGGLAVEGFEISSRRRAKGSE